MSAHPLHEVRFHSKKRSMTLQVPNDNGDFRIAQPWADFADYECHSHAPSICHIATPIIGSGCDCLLVKRAPDSKSPAQLLSNRPKLFNVIKDRDKIRR